SRRSGDRRRCCDWTWHPPWERDSLVVLLRQQPGEDGADFAQVAVDRRHGRPQRFRDLLAALAVQVQAEDGQATRTAFGVLGQDALALLHQVAARLAHFAQGRLLLRARRRVDRFVAALAVGGIVRAADRHDRAARPFALPSLVVLAAMADG